MNLIGKDIDGRYKILEEIGKGGMANVYKSFDKQLNRYVAVKVLKEDYRDDKEFVRRFNVEAQAAASLSNPHIVSIYDVGCEAGMHYIVMELIEGETLKNYIDRVGVIPWRDAANFSIQICEGIEEAHNNSVIHRDIKPQNIIMTPDGTLKITDFGIARATTQATMTMANNNTIGTAHYLSPEQARGGYTDERTDIYSMGVVMYEMLTGTLPFDDDSPVAIAIKHLQENAAPVTQLNPEVPKSFEYIVMKAMSKEQDRRYSSVTQMIAELKMMLANPNVNFSSEAPLGRRRTESVISEDNLDNTLKMPVIDDIDDNGFDIPGNDYDDFDEQDEEYEAIARLNEKRARRMKKKKDRKVAFIAFLSALAVLAVGFAVSYAFTDGFGIFGTQKDMVKIPTVVGMTLKDAQKQYGAEFSIIEKGKKESTMPVGTILEQTPSSGQLVGKSDSIIISVIVSSGESEVVIPDYRKMEIDEVIEDLEKLGLKYTIREEANAEVDKGLVFKQEPSAKSKVSAGDMVYIYVSNGPEKTSAPAVTEKPGTQNTTGTSTNNNTTDNKNENTNTNKDNQNSNTGSNNDNGNTSSGNTGGSGTSGGTSGGSSSSGGSNSGSNSGSGTSGGTSGGSSNSGSGTSSGASGGGSNSGSESGGAGAEDPGLEA